MAGFSKGGSGGINQLTGDVTAGPGTGSQAATLTATSNVNTIVGNLAAVATNVVRRSATATAGVGETTVFTGSTASQTITLPNLGTLTDGAYRIVNDATVAVNILGGTNSLSINGTVYSATTPYSVPAGMSYDFVYDGTGIWQAMAIAPSAATTVTGPASYGGASAVGSSLSYARADHDHGLPAAPSASLTTQISYNSANVNIPGGSVTTSVTTLSLAAGTWLVLGVIFWQSASTSAAEYQTLILLGATRVADQTAYLPSQAQQSIGAFAVITIASTTTVELAGVNNSSTTASAYVGTAAVSTGLVAIKIA